MSHAPYIHTFPASMRRGGLFGFVALMHALFLVSLSSLAKAPARPDDALIVAQMLPMGSGAPDAPPGPLPSAPKPPGPPLPARRPRPAPPRKPVPAVKPADALPRAIAEASAFEPSPSSSGPENTAPSASDGPEGGASGGGASGHAAPGGGGGGGGGESLARFDADYLRNPAPPYPAMSRRLREQGKVFLRVRVTPEGAAGDLEIKTSSGSARLDASALRTVRHWRFIPARRGGAAVASWVVVPIIFKLE